MKNKLNSKNTVFYSTANSGYALYSATSLITVRKHLPDADLYILSSGLSDKEKRILDKNNIKYMELDLSSLFTKTWDYPIDCYYMFAGPEIFRKQGYKFSVYMDGDVLCANNPISELQNINCVAGVASIGVKGKYSGIFGDDWNEIKKFWGIKEAVASRKRANAGVVYFNNERMAELSLLKTAQKIFKKSLNNNIPRKGDDSLFSLLQYLKIPVKEVLFLEPKYNYVIQFNDYALPPDDLSFFHFSLDKPWKAKPYEHTDKLQLKYNPYVKAWRKIYRKVDFYGYLKSSSIIFRKTSKTGEALLSYITKLAKFIKNVLYWIKGYKKNYISRKVNVRKPPIKLYWWGDYINGVFNFGDETTKDIILRIFGYRSIQVPTEEAELAGAGSIIEIIVNRNNDNKIHVWGSGFIRRNDEPASNLKGLMFSAVRGKKTASRVSKKAKSNIVLGDPGLLASIVYDRAKYKTDKIGVVVHYAEAEEDVVRKLKKDPRFLIIDPLKAPYIVAHDITSCKFVLSSSLHGIIFADSFRVPNKHVKFSDKVVGGTFKFEDYYSVTGRSYETANVNKIFDDDYLDEIIDSYKEVVNLKKIQKKLVKSFPKIR